MNKLPPVAKKDLAQAGKTCFVWQSKQ